MALAKNQLHTVTIDGYSSDGSGVGRIDGQAVFVQGALLGETCTVKLLKVSKTVAWAKIESIAVPSPSRQTPPCPVFGKCGGCDLMHMDYSHELQLKRQRVQDAVTRLGGLDLTVEPIIGADSTTHYRNKAIYAVGAGPATGFFRPRSHQIIPVTSCMIQSPVSDQAAAALQEWMGENGISAYDETTGKGLIRHLFVRHGTSSGQTTVCIVANGSKLPNLQGLIDTVLDHCPSTASIVLNVNRSRGNTVLQGEFRTLWGESAIDDTLCGLDFRLSPRSFYQINHAQAEKLYRKALDYAGLTGTETVLDLYCGTGTITLCLAQKAKQAIGAEIVPEAIADAEENARRNGIANTRFLCADAAQAAQTLRDEGLRPDVVVVDPPRKGLDPQVIHTISNMAPRRVVYVSCDPATMARDLKLFGQLGYTTRAVTPLDMFPRCAHVESVAQLELSASHN